MGGGGWPELSSYAKAKKVKTLTLNTYGSLVINGLLSVSYPGFAFVFIDLSVLWIL